LHKRSVLRGGRYSGQEKEKSQRQEKEKSQRQEEALFKARGGGGERERERSF